MMLELLMMILLLKHDMRECRCDHPGTRGKGSLHDFTLELLLQGIVPR